MANFLKKIMQKRAFTKAKEDFYSDAADARANGVSFNEFLKEEASREAKWGSKALSSLYYSWAATLANRNHSSGMAGAMASYISNQEATILSAFEESGKIGQGFLVASDTVNKINKIKSIYVKKLSYSFFSLLVAYFGAGSMYTVFPKRMPKDPPLVGEIAVAYTGFIHDHTWTILLFFAAIAGFVAWSLPVVGNSFRINFLDKYIMPYTTYKTFRASSYLIVMAALIKSGMALDKALTVSIKNSGSWMERYLLKIKGRLSNRNIEKPIHAFNVGLLDNRTYLRLESASEKSGLDVALNALAEKGFDRVLKGAELTAGVMSQVLTAVTGASIILMLAGILKTMFAVAKF